MMIKIVFFCNICYVLVILLAWLPHVRLYFFTAFTLQNFEI